MLNIHAVISRREVIGRPRLKNANAERQIRLDVTAGESVACRHH